MATFAPPVMTWSSSGAFADSGTFEFTESRWDAVPSPVVGTLHQTLTFTGASGTFTGRVHVD